MRRTWFRLFNLVLLLLLPAAAQDMTDFSGVWRMDASRSESAHQGFPIGSVMLVIQQNAAEISIETLRREKNKTSSETLTYRLDGSDSSLIVDSGTEVKTRAHWKGPSLVMETVRSIQGTTVTTLHTLSLDDRRKELTVDKTLTVQHGYQGQGAMNTGRGTDVFVRTKRSSAK